MLRVNACEIVAGPSPSSVWLNSSALWACAAAGKSNSNTRTTTLCFMARRYRPGDSRTSGHSSMRILRDVTHRLHIFATTA